MPGDAARTHTQASNRAQDRGERKVVFKGVLDNPFRISWPSVTLYVQNTALEICLAKLEGVAEYRMSRKRRRNSEEKSPKRRTLADVSAETHTVGLSGTQAMSCDQSTLTDHDGCSPILQHLVIGINEVTKRMESQIKGKRTIDDSGHSNLPPLQFIFVCRADVNPTILVDHLPHLVAAYNSLQPQVPVRLVPLPLGAEPLISKAIGFRKAAVLGVDSSLSKLTDFTESLDSVPILTASWLTSSIAVDNKFIPTHIKQTRTSAPKDMRAEKQRRKTEKAMKKRLKEASDIKSSGAMHSTLTDTR